MSVLPSHGEGEEYKEVVAFRAEAGPLRRLVMWRGREGIFIQPLPGRARRHSSVAEALDGLLPKQAVALTDMAAERLFGARPA